MKATFFGYVFVCVCLGLSNSTCTPGLMTTISTTTTNIESTSKPDVENEKIKLTEGSPTFKWWVKPPVQSRIKIYFYNVTNVDEFLNNGSKPFLQEVGPYVYLEQLERKNIKFYDNGTVSFNLQTIYHFDAEASTGSQDDLLVVPNIPMLSTTSQSKYAARFLRLALTSIMDILQLKPFVEVTVGQLLWGYKDPLLTLAKDVLLKEQRLPYEEFGVLYNKNGTSEDTITINTGVKNITKYGLIDRVNGKSKSRYYTTDECNSLEASDGSIFPPHMTKNTTLYLYHKDLCRRLPLVFQKEVLSSSNEVPAFRFSPQFFAGVGENPNIACVPFDTSPSLTTSTPPGFLNITVCQYDTPILLSFPHFYLADNKYRTAFDGISPPDPENHTFYMDIQPKLGSVMSARARIQINLDVSHVDDIKQVAKFPDIIFPIMWLEKLGSPPEEMKLLKSISSYQTLILLATIMRNVLLTHSVIFF